MKKELSPRRPPRGEAATEEDSERNISRKERKGRTKIIHHRGAEVRSKELRAKSKERFERFERLEHFVTFVSFAVKKGFVMPNSLNLQPFVPFVCFVVRKACL